MYIPGILLTTMKSKRAWNYKWLFKICENTGNSISDTGQHRTLMAEKRNAVIKTLSFKASYYEVISHVCPREIDSNHSPAISFIWRDTKVRGGGGQKNGLLRGGSRAGKSSRNLCKYSLESLTKYQDMCAQDEIPGNKARLTSGKSSYRTDAKNCKTNVMAWIPSAVPKRPIALKGWPPAGSSGLGDSTSIGRWELTRRSISLRSCHWKVSCLGYDLCHILLLAWWSISLLTYIISGAEDDGQKNSETKLFLLGIRSQR